MSINKPGKWKPMVHFKFGHVQKQNYNGKQSNVQIFADNKSWCLKQRQIDRNRE